MASVPLHWCVFYCCFFGRSNLFLGVLGGFSRRRGVHLFHVMAYNVSSAVAIHSAPAVLLDLTDHRHTVMEGRPATVVGAAVWSHENDAPR